MRNPFFLSFFLLRWSQSLLLVRLCVAPILVGAENKRLLHAASSSCRVATLARLVEKDIDGAVPPFPVSVLTYTKIGDPAGLDGFVLDWGRRFLARLCVHHLVGTVITEA